MADTPDIQYINGRAIDFGSAILKIDNQRYSAFRSIKFGQKLERTKIARAGKSRKPLATTGGKYAAEDVTISFVYAASLVLKRQLAAKGGGRSWGKAKVPMSLQFVEDGNEPISLLMENACAIGETTSVEDNADGIYVEISFSIESFTENGLSLYPEDE